MTTSELASGTALAHFRRLMEDVRRTAAWGGDDTQSWHVDLRYKLDRFKETTAPRLTHPFRKLFETIHTAYRQPGYDQEQVKTLADDALKASVKVVEETMINTTTLSVVVPITFTTQDLCDILTTAFEGGIGSWCRRYDVADAKPEAEYGYMHPAYGGSVLLHVEDEKLELTLTRLLVGLALYAQHHGWTGELGDIDAERASMIVQYGVFGEVVYG